MYYYVGIASPGNNNNNNICLKSNIQTSSVDYAPRELTHACSRCPAIILFLLSLTLFCFVCHTLFQNAVNYC